MTTRKFMVSLKAPVCEKLEEEAARVGCTIQELIRTTIIPFYFRFSPPYEKALQEQIIRTIPLEKSPWIPRR